MDYQIIRSSRKTIALQILPDGSVLVRAPKGLSSRAIREFVASKQHWLDAHLAKLPAREPRLSQEALRDLKAAAAGDLTARVHKFAPLVGVNYSRITIRAQHTRWGSCSGKGNLNFNCLLMLAPGAVRDYVVVHELCHRLQMNHSPAFWAEVGRVLPDFESSRRWLRDHGNALLGRLPEG